MSDSNQAPTIPGLFNLILEIPLVLLLGCVIGSLILIYHPVSIVDRMPAFGEPGVVYFRTPKASSSEREVVNKMIQLRGNVPPAVEVSEGEINTWASTSFSQLEPLSDQQRSTRTSLSRVELGGPMVRLEDGMVEVALIVRNSLMNQPVVDTPLQMAGDFSVVDGEFHYDLHTLYLGALPLHKLPLVGELVRERIVSTIRSGEVAEEIEQIMKSAKKVELVPANHKLVFHFERRNVVNP